MSLLKNLFDVIHYIDVFHYVPTSPVRNGATEVGYLQQYFDLTRFVEAHYHSVYVVVRAYKGVG